MDKGTGKAGAANPAEPELTADDLGTSSGDLGHRRTRARGQWTRALRNTAVEAALNQGTHREAAVAQGTDRAAVVQVAAVQVAAVTAQGAGGSDG